MPTPKLSVGDRRRLFEEINKLPRWAEGGRQGERSVLREAGLSEDWISDLNLTGTPLTDASTVISNLAKLGHLQNRPTYYALGALVEYLLDNTPHVEGKMFLAYLIRHYQLITNLDYLGELQERYLLLEVPKPSDLRDLKWQLEQPPFSWQGPTDQNQLEALWSKAPFLDAVFLEKGTQVARAVCIVETPTDQGTGFLIGPDLVLTNHHVVPTDDEAKATQVRFGYRISQTGQLMQGQSHQVKGALRRSPTEKLDYVVLQVENSPGKNAQIGYLAPMPKKLNEGSRLYIIQHPLGQPQKVVLQENCITYVSADQRRVQYLTNTQRGSSGSPVCNESWEVVALHHSGEPIPPLKTAHLHGNEGIPMAVILPEIEDLI